MKRVRKESHSITTIALAVALAVTASVAAAQGKKPPNPGGGGGEETSANNLSYPAVEIDSAASTASAIFKPSASTTPGVDFSYGCPDLGYPENNATYPNFSCMDGATYLTREQCAATGMPCAGRLDEIERIYWQKTANNDWSSDTSASGLGVDAPFVDWADNLETQTWWDTAAIRVETTPFGRVSPTQRGLQMWHVVGQGQTELWGVRATEPAAGVQPLAYVYNSDYAILHTTKARLNIAKMSGPNETCPTGAGQAPPVAQGTFFYTDTGGYWSQASTIGDKKYLYDVPYTAELNIGGKYVYGFNWQLRRDSVPATIGKTGWWRLTFYTKTSESATSAVTFQEGLVTFTPPPSADAEPTALPQAIAIAAEEGGALYTPQVIGGGLNGKNLSYIDICVSSSKGGGGKKGPK